MRVVDRYPAVGFFTGSRTLTVRSLPPKARVTSFRLTVTPIADAAGAAGPARELLSFVAPDGAPLDVARDPEDPARRTDVSRSTGFGPRRWTEIAFAGFRTPSHVEGEDLLDSALHVDVGGLFVEVDQNGTIPMQGSVFQLPGDAADLPGLSVRRMRLMAPTNAAPTPVVESLTLRAVASNLTVAIGDQPPVWARPGDVTDRVETGELAEFAQAALAEARVDNGLAVLPVTVKTDTTARLAIDVVTEYEETATGLPDGLAEMTLDYAHDATADAGDDLLTVAAPDGMELDPARTRVEIDGSFEGSEIGHGPLADRAPAASLTLPEGHAAAAPVSVTAETVADAVDLLLSTQRRNAGIEIDLREDFDGKPGDVSLLAKPAGAALDVSRHAAPHWLSVALGQPVTLPAADPISGKPRIWVVVQAVAGPLDWHLNPAGAAATAQMQTSDDGGLSWRPARVQPLDGALDPGLRLRRASPVFRVPVRAEIGRGAEATELALDRFQPLGRVAFALDAAAFAGAVNAVLAGRRSTACPRGEQLANGGFADRDNGESYRPGDWTVSGGTLGRRRFMVEGLAGTERVRLIRIGGGERPAQSISQVVPVAPGCPYRLTFRGFRQSPGARVELIWRGPDCGVLRVDTLEPPEPLISDQSQSGDGLILLTIPAASLDAAAPEGVDQAELRVAAEPDVPVFVDALSLVGGPAALINPDFREFVPSGIESERLRGWQVSPAGASEDDGFTAALSLDGLTLTNGNTQGRRLILSQRLPVAPGAPFAAGLDASVPADYRDGPAPAFGAIWLDGTGAAVGAPLAAGVAADGAAVTRLAATVPEGVAQAEIRIEIAPGSSVTLHAVAADTRAPECVPVSFLSEAPGRLTVRDFTLGFRPAPAPPPVFTATPCAPTPADRAPGDVCEPDPCCGADPPDPAAPVPIEPLGGISVIDAVTSPAVQVAQVATPLSSLVSGLPAASATARIAEIAARRRRAGTVATRRRVETVGPADRSVAEVNGVGAARTARLARLGIVTVRDLAQAAEGDLVRELGFDPRLARNLIARARTMAGIAPA